MKDRSVGLFFYELLWLALRCIFKALGLFAPRLRAQLADRDVSPARLKAWQEERRLARGCVVFFCSSAGEYEQAKPLARRLREEHGRWVIFFFGSESARRFAEAQGEKLPYHKAPWDNPRAWRLLARALCPDFFVVVRYELWPGFLCVNATHAPIYLIDAVQSQSLQKNAWGRWIWKKLLLRISHVFAVATADQVFFHQLLAYSQAKISVVGDSKYDRVLERIEERSERAAALQLQLRSFRADSKLLIVGSAWPADVEVVLKAYQQLKRARVPFKLVVAPHDVSPQMGQLLVDKFEAMELKVCRVSQKGLDAVSATDDVLLVDAVGFLAELYACADLAWIGGAMHHRVHNVLEAACRGLYLCFGPRYRTSQEAVWLVEQGLARVVEESSDFLAWVETLEWGNHPPHQALWKAVTQQQGASERMLDHMLRLS